MTAESAYAHFSQRISKKNNTMAGIDLLGVVYYITYRRILADINGGS